MTTWMRTAALVAIAVMSVAPAVAETLVKFDPEAGALPEGVAVDKAGNVYASLSPLGKLVKIAPGANSAEDFGQVSGFNEGDFGLIGLAVDASGDIYGGVFSANPDAHGVWRFDGTTGAETRVDGSQNITLPNAVDFAGNGTMYVTDTIAGAIWRVPAGGAAEEWITDPLLAGNGNFGFPFPVGANGIVVQDGVVYVGVSETGRVVTVPINNDGSAGEASVFAEVADVFIDGIALDEQGNVYITNPMVDAIVKVSADGTVDTIAGAGDGLDTPTSLVFGKGADNGNTLYVANFSIALGRPLGAGPSIVAIEMAQ